MNHTIHPSRWFHCWRFLRTHKENAFFQFLLDSGLFLLIIPIVLAYSVAKFVPASPVPIRSTTKPPPYAVKYEQTAAKLKIGMTVADVRDALGEPTIVRVSYEEGLPSSCYCLCIYTVDTNHLLRIRFNADEKVVTWKMVSAANEVR